jgi:glycosyltransferase involved in cell wall biosynthesis
VNRLALSRVADSINGVSQFSVESLAHVDGFSSSPLEVIPNGIDAWRYAQGTRTEAKRALGLDPDRRYIACIARFHPIKDHAMLIEAFAQVAATLDDVDLLLAGDGPLRGDLEQRAAERGIAGRVHFLGVRGDVPVVLRAADVFALTSICEAASITLLEAMASELPVVVTAVGGNPELVEDGRQGWLVPRGDASAAAAALLTLLADPARAAAMGAAARARVIDRYQLDATVNAYYTRYADAVADIRRRGPQPRAVPA